MAVDDLKKKSVTRTSTVQFVVQISYITKGQLNDASS